MQAIELLGSEREQQIALRGVRVRARLSGMSQKTVVEQMFINLEPRAIEAVYTFPLPEGAAVCGFEVITGDRVLTSTIEENEKAIETYDDAIDQGHGAFMIEADRPDVFTARVGNLKPRQAATIRLTYVAPLERVDKQVRVTFPTTVAPRYAGSAGMDPLEGMIDAETLNPPKAWQVSYGLSLEVDVDLGRKIKTITSPTHSIQVTDNDGASRVLLDGAMTKMDRDIVLSIDLAKEHEPSAEVGVGPDGAAYVAVTFVPEFDVDELTDSPPSETIFVLDCSGSMQGESIEQATRALELCLRSLSPGDTFNICRFGSTFEMMSSEPLVYSQQTLTSALKYIDRRADLGGTEILPALQAIFETKPLAGTARNMIVLTDGQVSNEPAVTALARKHREQNRIFSFGIGSAASAFLVRGLARATRGAAEFITGRERIENKVLRTFSRIASPMVEQIEVDWGAADVKTLAEIPPVFDGDVMTVFGRVQGTPPNAVQLRCVARGKPMSWPVQLPRQRDDDGVIATMWARRTIQSLEEVNDVRRLHHADKSNRERQLIIETSKQFNLVSSLTTFIAIEHRSIENRNEGRPELRRVPVALAAGWGGKPHDSLAAGTVVMACMAPSPARMMCRTIDQLADSFAPMKRRGASLGDMVKSFVSGMAARDEDSGASKKSRRAPADDLQALLALQSADGWFDFDEPLVSKLAPKWKDLEHRIHHSLDQLSKQAIPQEKQIAHTAMVLLILEAHFKDRENLWRRAAQKARRWLASATNTAPARVQQWLSGLLSQI